MQVNTKQNATNFGAITVGKGALKAAFRQYRLTNMPHFVEDMQFVKDLDERLVKESGKGLSFHISSDGDSLVYRTANLTTKDLSEAVLDSMGDRTSPDDSLYEAIKTLGKFPRK